MTWGTWLKLWLLGLSLAFAERVLWASDEPEAAPDAPAPPLPEPQSFGKESSDARTHRSRAWRPV